MDMSTVNSAASAAASTATSGTSSSEGTKKTKVAGRTIGDAQLSEKAQKYYSELQKKYGNMDFILVSPDMKKMAEANAGAYATANRTVVLIDTDKIEKMAEDEQYRAKYEGIISNAGNKISQMVASIKSTGANVKTVGMKINDGGNASFFAVIDKSYADQKKRISANAEKKAAAKKADKKAQEKKAQKEKQTEKSKESGKDEDTVTITASSPEELNRKIQDYLMWDRVNYVETDEEKMVGHNFNFTA